MIQVTRDGGKTWTKTDKFPDVPETTFVSRVVWSQANEGTIYATLDGHRSNDFKPYVVKSTDYGKTWTSITGDLPDGGSVQVIREHPRQPNLLFVGTEFGVYLHHRRRRHWTQLKSGIPGVPVHDLQIQARANDLVLGTHGRGIYILDDHHAARALAKAKSGAGGVPLSRSRTRCSSSRTRARNSGMGTRGFTGQNPDPGPRISYLLNAVPRDAKMSLFDRRRGRHRRARAAGHQTAGPVSHRRGTCASDRRSLARSTYATARGGRGGGRRRALVAAAGRRRRRSVGGPWRRRRGWRGPGGAGGGRGGAADNTFPALPGKYVARLTVTPAQGTPTVLEQSFALTKDPMVTLSEAELKQLYAFRLDVVKTQRALREKQAQLDTAQRLFAAAKRAADSAGTKSDA